MANEQAIQEAILRAVDTIVTQRNSELQLDKTIIATIRKNIGLKNEKTIYQLQYNGGFINAICQNKEDIYLPNTAVYVLIPQGNFSNEKIIIGLANSDNIQEKKINAATKSYAKLSANLLNNTNEIYGLHSWHEDDHPNDTDSSHRYQYLYQRDKEKNITFNKETLDICKDDMTALMIQADFRTNLDIEQRYVSNASYGLIFNFIFNTSNKTYGETNGEIFDNLAPTIIGYISDKEYNLAYFDEKITEDDFSAVSTDLIWKYSDQIEKVYADFIQRNSESQTDWIRDLVLSYSVLLVDLARQETPLDRKTVYNEWRNTKVGDPTYRYEQYILSSREMTGNPFLFNQWSNQQTIFEVDINALNNLDSIIFFQEGFNQNYDNEQIWPPSDPGAPDILVTNLQLYALKSLSEINEYSLKVEPYNNSNFIINENSEILEFKATLLRQSYEDLTDNINTNLYWFKESLAIMNTTDEGYNALAGLGWEEIIPNNTSILSIAANDNQALKNNYKCIAQYNDIKLEYNFIIYRKTAAIEIKLESDLGTEFVFDVGNPTIIVKVKNNDYEEEFKEIGYSEQESEPEYKYIWCIVDGNNNKVFLNKLNSNISTMFSQSTFVSNIKQKILLLNGNLIDSFNPEYTTRISCPIANITDTFTVICYIQRKNDNEYYDVGMAQLTFHNTKNNINVADYKIQFTNDDQVFKYDVYGKSPISAANKNPLEIKALKVKFFTPNEIEINPENYEVEWIIPEENTTLLIPINQNKYGCSFTIKENYDPDCYNNQITCHIQFAGKHFYKDTKFYFGKEGNNGTNGTDVIAKIEYAKDDDYENILSKEPVTIYIQENIEGSFINTDLNRNFITSQLLFEDLVEKSDEEIKPIFKTSLYQRSEKIEYSNAPVYSLAGNRKGKYFSVGTKMFFEEENNDDILPLIQNIKTEIKVNNEETYYAFISIPIIKYQNNLSSVSDLISIDKRYWLNEIVYNADGRNPIYNHNQGLKLNLPDNIARVHYFAKGGFNKNKNSEGEYIYYENEPCFSLLEEKDSQTKVTSLIKTDSNKNMVYVFPNDSYGGSITNNRVEAWCYDENDQLIATVYAPINMTLNTFGLASLNAWDGNTVTIDNDGGYVMAPQIGAGEKDNNNRFTGILMGKTETYTGGVSAEKQVGLFGYSCGLQSIFLDAETGNATFGLPEGYTIKESNGISIPVQELDEYNEGRIELRPGGESKIGGWKIGRRSLYYTIKPSPMYLYGTTDVSGYELKDDDDSNYKYRYSGEIGPRYSNDQETPNNKQYAAHHVKDINVHDAGILFSSEPPYMSIVGTMLTEQQVQENANGYLSWGDSIELQLDPQTPTVFTIFRHNSEKRKQEARDAGKILGDRTFLAGINARGQLQANIIGSSNDSNSQISMYFDATDPFNTSSNNNDYLGAIFEATTKSIADPNTFLSLPFLKILIEKEDIAKNETGESVQDIDSVYISTPNVTFKLEDILRIYDD